MSLSVSFLRALSGVAALALGLAPLAARAEPEEDLLRQAALAERFAPFEQVQGEGWESAFPTPYFRAAAEGEPDAVHFELEKGAYVVLALCTCEAMQVTLVKPDFAEAPADRSNATGAMYVLDVANPGQFLVGVDMTECAEEKCGFAVKAYRRKPGGA